MRLNVYESFLASKEFSVTSDWILALVDSLEPRMYEKHDLGGSNFKLCLMSASLAKNSTCTVNCPNSHNSVLISTSFVCLPFQSPKVPNSLRVLTARDATS